MLRGIDGWDSEHFAFGATESPAAAASAIAVNNGPEGPTATIPDAHLLFTAQFSRAGADLILQGEDGKIVAVHDYFATDARARLLSPEGAALTPDVVAALAGPLAPGQFAQAGATQVNAQAVGRVAQVEGGATIIRNGVAMQANTGDAILKGDVLQTVTGSLGVTFNDGSTLNITANSRLVVNEFVYDPRGSQNSQLLDLVQGSLTFISGEVAHSGDMKIGTPVATMGIRGTVGGVTTANDGTVRFYVSQSATGAVILDSRGTIIANVVQDGPLIVVRPVGPLQVLAEELQKSPAQLATELAALQHIVSIKSVGDQLIQQFFQQNPTNNPNPQSTDHPHTQIPDTQIDLKPDPLAGAGNNNDGNTPPVIAIVTPPPSTPGTPLQPDPVPIIIPIPVNLPPINFGPLNAATGEDQTLTFAGQRAISVFDADTGILKVTLSATHGILTLSSVAGLTFAPGDSNGTAAMTFLGTQAAINAALHGMNFTPDADYNGDAAVTITTTDGNSTTATDSIAITVNAVNDAPAMTPGTAVVSEEGLCGGIADCAGNPDTTNGTTASGIIAATDVDGDTLTFSLGTPSATLTSNGVPICWELCGNNKLTGVAGETTVITIEIDPQTGGYTVTLSGPIDHPDGCAEDIKSFDVPVNVTDGTATAVSGLTVAVEDDRPHAVDRSVAVTAGATAITANIVIILDISGSMDGSNITLAKAALQNLLTTDQVQINQVMALGFSDHIEEYAVGNSYWANADNANDFLQGLDTGGGTNYSDAIARVMANWGSGPTAADQTLVYFISDGVPSSGQGLDSPERVTTTEWENFLLTHNVDVSNAIGISTNVSNIALAPIAWATPDNSGLLPIILNDASDLDGTLQGTVENTGAHNIFSDGETTDAGFGADGGHIASIEIDGVTYSWDGESLTKSEGECTVDLSGSSISVETELGGRIDFYFAADGEHSAGDWSYKPPASLTAPTNEIFHYVLTDNDGDRSGADITVSVTADNFPPAVDLDSTQPGTGYQTSAVANDTAVAIFGDNVIVSDIGMIESASVRLMYLGGNGNYAEYTTWSETFSINLGALAGATLDEETDTYTLNGFSGLHWSVSNGASGLVLNIGGDADAVTYTQLLEAVRFSSHTTNFTDRVATVTVDDGEFVSQTATATISMHPNNLPVAADDHLIFASDNILSSQGSSYIFFPFDFLAVNDDPDGGDAFTNAYADPNGTFGSPQLGDNVSFELDGNVVYQLSSEQPVPFEDSFIYRISNNGTGETTSEATVTLSVTASPTLEGDGYNDIIVGGLSDETMTGHGGADGFVFLPANGHDTITDFISGEDKIVIANFDPNLDSGMSAEEAAFLLNPNQSTFSDWKAGWSVDTEANSVTFALHYDSGSTPTPTDTVTVANADLDSLTVNDFIVHNIVGMA